MRSKLVLALMCSPLAFLLVGCAAFGVPESKDPMVKLDQARYLEYHESRRWLPTG